MVKGIQMDGLRVIGSVLDIAKDYYSRGIDEIVIIDVVASLYGRDSMAEIIREVTADCFVPVTVGGGIRTLADADILFRAGADKVAINTGAISDPGLIGNIASKYGSQAVVVSIQAKADAALGWECYTESGREPTGISVKAWVSEAESRGAGEFFLTSVDRDGTKKGPDWELVKMVRQFTTIPLISASGIKDADDVARTFVETQCEGVAIGSALHYRAATLEQIRASCRNFEVPVREAED